MKRYMALLAALALTFVCHPLFAAQQGHVGLNDVISTVENSFKAGPSGEAPIADFMADFFQRTFLAKEGREMRGEGQISARLANATSPLMYRFQYFSPYRQEIVSDGNSLWIYHPENREVILSDVSFVYNRPGFNPDRDRAVNFLQGLGRISKDFQINFAAGMYDSAGNYVLELNPRHSMLNTRRILLVVNRLSVLSQATAKNGRSAAAVVVRPSQPSSRPSLGPSAQFDPLPPIGGVSDPFPLLSTTVEDQAGNSTTMELTNIRINNRFQQNSFSFLIPPGVQVVRPSELNQPR
jgi:outer membrane lipoprotein-sorting protein